MNNPFDPAAKLEQLLRLPAENEIVEFKKAESGKYFDEIRKYFAALSNEANLKSVTNGGIDLASAINRALVGFSQGLVRV